MIRNINKFLLVSGCVLLFAGCDDNSWNDKLPGFQDPDPVPTDVQKIDYTLTAIDYKTLADNSENKALAGSENANALSAVGSQAYFTDVITAEKYIPALLNDPKFPYFALDNGSAINVTYRTATAMPEEVSDIAAAAKYAVTEADYQTVWDSEEDYTMSFAPSHTAARSIPGLLKTAFPDAANGDYVIVNYNTSATDPVFQTAPEPEKPFELSNVIKDAVKGDAVTINGYVSALSTQGFVLTDASGSIFVYRKSSEPFSDLKIGSEITLDGTVSINNYGKQIDTGSTYVEKGERAVSYPAPAALTGADLEAMKATADAAYKEDKNAGKTVVVVNPYFVSLSGTLKVNGSNINIIVDGAQNAQGSVYGANDALKAQLTDGASVTVEGYLIAIAGGRYFNIVVTKLNGATIATAAARRAAASRAAVSVPSVNENAVYKFDGSAWSVAPSTSILSHADYQAMGQTYDNLSGTTPATVLPKYLTQKYPYAVADETVFVAYYYYNGSATVTRCDQYTFDGSQWNLFDGIMTETSQFVKNKGHWTYDPSLTIDLPAGKGQALSTLYFQTCVDWVKDNVPDGSAYISSYGNNEYYCGTSAYQGNVDLRPGAAKAAYAGYESMTDDEVVALEKQRFETEVMPGALAILHPNLKPVDGVDVKVTINFYFYNAERKTLPATIIYNVTGQAQFEFVSCTWND